MAFSVSYNIRAIDEFSKTLNNIKKNFSNFNQEISGSFQKANNSSKNFNKNIESVKKNTSKISNNLKGMSNNIKTNNLSLFDRFVQNIGNSVAIVGSKIKSSFGGISNNNLLKGLAVGGIVAGSAVKASNLEQDQKRLSVLLPNIKNLNKYMSNMRQLSIDTNKPMSELTNSFRLLLEQGKGGKSSFNDLQKQLDISTYTGISSNEITRLFTQVNQSGKITNEILNSLNDKGLQLKGILAKMQGMSFKTPYERQAFDQMISTGAMTNKELNLAVKEWFNTHKDAKNISKTLTQTGTIAPLIKIKNAFFDITTSMWQSFAASTHLNNGLNVLSNKMSHFANSFRNFSQNHSTTSGFLSIIAGLSLFRGSLALTKGMWKGFASLLTGQGFMNSLKVLGHELLKPFTSLKSVLGWLSSKMGEFSKFLGLSTSLMLTPQVVGGGDLSKRKYDFYNQTLPEKPQMNMHNQTNTETLYNLLGIGNQQMTSNINLNIESNNADIKSIKTHHSGGKSNFHVGVNPYRR